MVVHALRGVEIYEGKPIFYGMGEFFRQMNWSLETQFGTRISRGMRIVWK